MATSPTSICNMALVSLGAPQILDVITEDTEQAKKCNALYPTIRDEELSAHPWNFATVLSSVALTVTVPAYGYTKAFQKPSDCLRILTNENDDTYLFRVIGDKVYSNESSLKIEYIKQITDTSQFSPAFTRVLVARLKYELSYAFTEEKFGAFPEKLFKAYEMIRRKAWAEDSQEGSQVPKKGDQIIIARQGTTY